VAGRAGAAPLSLVAPRGDSCSGKAGGVGHKDINSYPDTNSVTVDVQDNRSPARKCLKTEILAGKAHSQVHFWHSPGPS